MNAKWGTLVFIGVMILTLILTSGCTQQNITGRSVLPTNNSERTAQQNCKEVPYKVPECRTVYYEEPYETEECNQVELKYTWTGVNKRTTFSLTKGCVATASTTIRNMDTEETGQWTVKFTFETLKERNIERYATHYIYPGETQEFSASYDVKCGEDWDVSLQIIPATKTVCKKVTKYRTATRQECTDVIKYKKVCE